MTREEAIEVLKKNYPSACYSDLCNAVDVAIDALQEVERLKKAIEDIKAEIEKVTKCPYSTCVGAEKCANTNDCMLIGEHAIEIIDRHISRKEK